MLPIKRRAALYVASALMLVSTACTAHAARTSPSSGPSVVLTGKSPSAVDAASEAALAAYRGMWRAYAAAGATGATSSPDLMRYASGEALDALRIALRSLADGGLVLRGNAIPNAKIQEITLSSAPNTAVVVDCLDDRNFKRVKASPGGAPFSDSPGGFRRVTATVKAVDGVWKVTLLDPGGVGTCQPG